MCPCFGASRTMLCSFKNMTKRVFVIATFALDICLFPRILAQPPRSPCPELFKYEKLEPGGDIFFPNGNHMFWKGVVTVPAKVVTPAAPFNLRLMLALPAAMETKYVGHVVFRGDKQKFLEAEIKNGTYDVLFPRNKPVPHLLQIRANDRLICKGMPPPSPVLTKLVLTHTLLPLRVNLSRRVTFDVQGEDSMMKKGVELRECGYQSRTNPLVVQGRLSNAGEWPWLVPLFRKVDTGRGVHFLCASTLISDLLIVTAAHCVFLRNASELLAYPGRQNIDAAMDSEYWATGITSVLIHPDFNPDSLYSDLAILHLESRVTWSATTFPACLWQGSPELDIIVNQLATVVGWGTDEASKAKLTSLPNSVALPVVSQETCLRSSRGFYFLSSNRTLCAGARNGVGPCNGDSGGGLYVSVEDSTGYTQWYLRGVVSVSLQDKDTKRCDLHQYTVFTDVAQFIPWIHSVEELDFN